MQCTLLTAVIDYVSVANGVNFRDNFIQQLVSGLRAATQAAAVFSEAAHKTS